MSNPYAGWQFLHVAIDDHARVAYGELFAMNVAPVRRFLRLVATTDAWAQARPAGQWQVLALPAPAGSLPDSRFIQGWAYARPALRQLSLPPPPPRRQAMRYTLCHS